MQFLFPWFTLAALTLAVPIIIHLFHFRRYRKVMFTNVRFLREIKDESSNRRKLRNLLVLAARCLALLALVFGFAQPFLQRDTEVKQGRKSVSVFIDNSFSMSALSEDIGLLEKAKERAREIVRAYAEDDRFQVLTCDFEGRHQRLLSKEDALVMIDEVKASPAVQEISRVLTRQAQALQSGGTALKVAFVLSDFQKNVADFAQFKDSTIDVNLVPMQAVQEKNVSIDSVWFDAPVQMLNQTNPLVVRVTNYGNEAAESVRLTLRHDGQDKPVGLLTIPANSSVTDTVPITILKTGWHQAELTITDYPVQFDDSYFFTFNVAAQINVLVINQSGGDRYLDAALRSIAGFVPTNVSVGGLDFGKFKTNQLIVLNGLSSVSSGLASELKQFADQGGNVLVFPGTNADITSYQAFLGSLGGSFGAYEAVARECSGVNTDEFIFKDVYINTSQNLRLPSTKGNYRLRNTAESLINYRDGSPFIAKLKATKGNIYICAAPLEASISNLGQSGEVFVPLLYKSAISSARTWQIAYTISKTDFIEAENSITIGGDITYKMRGKSGEFIPEQRNMGAKVALGIGKSIREAGFYDLYLKQDTTLARYAFNYDRKESQLEYLDAAALKTAAGTRFNVIDAAAAANFTALVGERNKGITFWRWCLVIALLALLAEALMLRFWKV